jgi:hypothetical protein
MARVRGTVRDRMPGPGASEALIEEEQARHGLQPRRPEFQSVGKVLADDLRREDRA